MAKKMDPNVKKHVDILNKLIANPEKAKDLGKLYNDITQRVADSTAASRIFSNALSMPRINPDDVYIPDPGPALKTKPSSELDSDPVLDAYRELADRKDLVSSLGELINSKDTISKEDLQSVLDNSPAGKDFIRWMLFAPDLSSISFRDFLNEKKDPFIKAFTESIASKDLDKAKEAEKNDKFLQFLNSDSPYNRFSDKDKDLLRSFYKEAADIREASKLAQDPDPRTNYEKFVDALEKELDKKVSKYVTPASEAFGEAEDNLAETISNAKANNKTRAGDRTLLNHTAERVTPEELRDYSGFLRGQFEPSQLKKGFLVPSGATKRMLESLMTDYVLNGIDDLRNFEPDFDKDGKPVKPTVEELRNVLDSSGYGQTLSDSDIEELYDNIHGADFNELYEDLKANKFGKARRYAAPAKDWSRYKSFFDDIMSRARDGGALNTGEKQLFDMIKQNAADVNQPIMNALRIKLGKNAKKDARKALREALKAVAQDRDYLANIKDPKLVLEAEQDILGHPDWTRVQYSEPNINGTKMGALGVLRHVKGGGEDEWELVPAREDSSFDGVVKNGEFETKTNGKHIEPAEYAKRETFKGSYEDARKWAMNRLHGTTMSSWNKSLQGMSGMRTQAREAEEKWEPEFILGKTREQIAKEGMPARHISTIMKANDFTEDPDTKIIRKKTPEELAKEEEEWQTRKNKAMTSRANSLEEISEHIAAAEDRIETLTLKLRDAEQKGTWKPETLAAKKAQLLKEQVDLEKYTKEHTKNGVPILNLGEQQRPKSADEKRTGGENMREIRSIQAIRKGKEAMEKLESGELDKAEDAAKAEFEEAKVKRDKIVKDLQAARRAKNTAEIDRLNKLLSAQRKIVQEKQEAYNTAVQNRKNAEKDANTGTKEQRLDDKLTQEGRNRYFEKTEPSKPAKEHQEALDKVNAILAANKKSNKPNKENTGTKTTETVNPNLVAGITQDTTLLGNNPEAEDEE
jgi:hypothetical protein